VADRHPAISVVGRWTPLSEQQINISPMPGWIWISHGHPDHLHDESLGLLRQVNGFLLAGSL